MFKGKKVIIFDMDGTLIDSVGVWNQVDTTLINPVSSVSKPDEKGIMKPKFPFPYLYW